MAGHQQWSEGEVRACACAMRDMGIRVGVQVSKYVNMGQLKFYFQVNTAYVGKKLRLLVFPMHTGGGQDPWVRVEKDGKSLPPKDDINAPDLYIPGSPLLCS